MRRDFNLENGIYCEGEYNNFKLYYNKTELTPYCYEIRYIPGTLIAVKSKKTVYIYIPKVITENDNICLAKAASFDTINCNAYLKIKLNNKIYIIDSNVGISICECSKF